MRSGRHADSPPPGRRSRLLGGRDAEPSGQGGGPLAEFGFGPVPGRDPGPAPGGDLQFDLSVPDAAAGAVPEPGLRPGLSRRGLVAIGVAGVVLLGGGAWGALTLSRGVLGSSAEQAVAAGRTSPARTTGPRSAVEVGTAFLTAWQEADYPAMQALVIDQQDSMERAYAGMAARLKLSKVVVRPLEPAGDDLPFRVTLTLAGHGDVGYDGAVHLRRLADGWRVAFTSDTVYPGLTAGQRLDLVDSQVAAGLPLVPPPTGAGAAPSTGTGAGTAPSTDPTASSGTVPSTGPTATGDPASVADGRGRLLDRNGRPLSEDHDLGVNVVGSVRAGRGTSGLQRLLDDRLAGQPVQALAVVNASTGEPVQVVARFPAPEQAPDIRTTLDLRIQTAADQALSRLAGRTRAALVAVDTRTGEVRAIANQPDDGLPPALATQYAPGSTFKVVTATAALLAGVGPGSQVPCPGTISAGGVTFHNHERSRQSTLTLTQAFANSCNTAFISLAKDLPPGALQKAAATYGFGAGPLLPVAEVGADLPTPASPQEAAADAIGQGRVGASPLAMAAVAAAVADGTWRQPHLLPCPDCSTHSIPVAPQLRVMMRAVVTTGTGTAAARVAGGAVYGKTGTAEYGSGSPPPTHAWFIGWQGRTAFAVFVEDGSSGGAVAAPIAARFLRLIGGG